MTPLARGTSAVILAAVVSALAAPDGGAAAWAPATKRYVSEEVRHNLIRRAQVWAPSDVASADLRAGPRRIDGFQPGELVTCTYTPHKREGNNPKFHCRLADGRVVKVKYGAENGEIYGEVLATRLLWALGFGADAQYPVRVRCHGCSSDPWHHVEATSGTTLFEDATIELPIAGSRIETRDGSGWKWPELDAVDEAEDGAPRAQRDGLKLLAVLLQHTDSKGRQQRIVCLDEGVAAADCVHPLMYLHDVGLTFGKANALNRNETGSANFAKWAAVPIWSDPDACIGDMEKSMTGTLDKPRISEGGRAFLAALLVQLTDRQIRDLFDVARVERRTPGASVDDWVAAFTRKRDAIVNHRCPA